MKNKEKRTLAIIVAAIIVAFIILMLVSSSLMPASAVLYNIKCSGDNIAGRIGNTLDERVALEDVRVLFNGNVVDTEELRCDKSTLNPGESTYCYSLQGVVPTAGTNEISVVIGTEQIQREITC